jgi:dTDP-4-amino-4,6-dideoxygalactose transaminase
LYQLRIKGFEESQRDELISKLSSFGIGVNVHYIPLPMLSYFKKIGLEIKNFPSSYNLYKNEISLPIYNGLSEENVNYICSKLTEIINKII